MVGSPKSSQLPNTQRLPTPISADGGRQMDSRKISAKPPRAQSPACKVHGVAVVVVQVAMTVHPSPVAKGDLNHLNYSELKRLQRLESGWPSISFGKGITHESERINTTEMLQLNERTTAPEPPD